ncbi:hypothetical protein TCE0_044f16365 [Talaromyces pinophilus]|uniref:Major facilitator superfamily (MFS) profile domain-containing protein n=1 Tax=Talaromyces pinophilus TaxID=128442 RepID=A0A478EBG8_TALPI|nr:hypothetical protein TCE0_044f16365 [Talaromyces pinophilus]
MSNLHRTIISIATLSIQALCGIIFIIQYFTYYVQLVGYSSATSFQLSVGLTILCMAGNIASWFLVDRIGRRDLSLLGLSVIIVILFVCGGLGVPRDNLSCTKGVISLMIVYCVVYNATIGATVYNLVAEVSTPGLRAKTASIGLALQNAFYTMFSFVLPYLFNTDQANLRAKTMFVFGGCSVLSLIYLWFCQPETRGRTYQELDEMFMKRVPARKFRSFVTDAEQ